MHRYVLAQEATDSKNSLSSEQPSISLIAATRSQETPVQATLRLVLQGT